MLKTKERQRLLDRLDDPQARSRFKANQIRERIAAQIRLLREKRGWTQAELGNQAGIPQPRISLLEDPDYSGITIKTLARLSDALDVGLVVGFAPFSDLIDWAINLTPEKLAPPSYTEETQQPKTFWNASAYAGQIGIAAGIDKSVSTYKVVGTTESSGWILRSPSAEQEKARGEPQSAVA